MVLRSNLVAASITFALSACGTSSAPPLEVAGDAGDTGLGASLDSAREDGIDSGDAREQDFGAIDAAAIMNCPTSGVGAFDVMGVTCLNFTPADAGAASTGANATVANYAVRPAGAAPKALVLFFAGSRGRPAGPLKADPSLNLYAAAAAAGRAALGISYSNALSLGMLCKHDDACYYPSRESIILGTSKPGSAIAVSADEAIVDRTAKALRFLAAADPAGGWGGFLTTLDPAADPKTAIAWPKIIAVGHSQGGGHAVAVGKLFPVARVVQLSSACDSIAAMTVASWTNGAAGTWASNPTQFYGFASTGDTTCPNHTLNWENLGMVASHRDDGAAICGATGDTHDESLRCKDNYPAWVKLFE